MAERGTRTRGGGDSIRESRDIRVLGHPARDLPSQGYDPGIPRIMGQHGPGCGVPGPPGLKRPTVIVMGQPVGL